MKRWMWMITGLVWFSSAMGYGAATYEGNLNEIYQQFKQLNAQKIQDIDPSNAAKWSFFNELVRNLQALEVLYNRSVNEPDRASAFSFQHKQVVDRPAQDCQWTEASACRACTVSMEGCEKVCWSCMGTVRNGACCMAEKACPRCCGGRDAFHEAEKCGCSLIWGSDTAFRRKKNEIVECMGNRPSDNGEDCKSFLAGCVGTCGISPLVGFFGTLLNTLSAPCFPKNIQCARRTRYIDASYINVPIFEGVLEAELFRVRAGRSVLQHQQPQPQAALHSDFREIQIAPIGEESDA